MNHEHKLQQAIDDGFSSDQEIKHEQILVQHPKVQEPEHTHRQQVKFKLPPPEQIRSKPYSLNPDIATGWSPRNDLPVPIPLIFQHKKIDSMIRRISDKKNSKMQLVYLGPRYQNTFYAWFDKPFTFPYQHIKVPANMKFTNRLFSGNSLQFYDGLIFDSFFQAGNLDCAVRVGQREYDLYIRVDSNTRGHLQWYNFKIKNLQKLQKYKINICNFQKNKSLYCRGMKPYVFSQKKYEKQNIEWEQCGECITYEKKTSKSSKILNMETCLTYKLSFEYYTEFEDDEVQMAYCVPYTYSNLITCIKSLEKQTQHKQFFSKTKLCTSLGGLEVPLLIIHEHRNRPENYSLLEVPKKCIVISGRAHPGQSNGSHMMQGFLQYLCSDCSEAQKLRASFIFKIVPMLNPDGVALGNYRTGISGKDFNRQYRNPQKAIFPQVYAFKKLVSSNKAIYGDNLIMFLDFHGHSTKKNVFMYGPQFPIIQKHYYECRVFPKLLSNLTNMFRYYSCTFRVSEFKQTTARAVLLRKLMIPFSYTIQASNGSFYDQEKLKDVNFNKKHWEIMGRKIGECLAIYGDMVVTSEKNRIQKRRERLRKKDVRRSSKGRSLGHSSNSNNSLEVLGLQRTILPDNDKMQNIFEEIREAQQERKNQKNEEDNMSEGSSDGEGEGDDLSQQKLQYLFSIIKNEKLSSPETFNRKMLEPHTKTFENEELLEEASSQQLLQSKKEDGSLQETSIELTDTIFRTNNPNMRGYFFRNNKINQTAYLQEQKNLKVAAKIINFSFIGQNKYSQSPKRNRNRGEISERHSHRKNSSSELIQTRNKNKKVLDLSDSIFHQTQGTNFRNYDRFIIIDPKSTTHYKASPHKMISRLEEFKYRRLFINEYRV